MIRCPYCANFVSVDAQICPDCNGILTIASIEAIRQALILEPALAIRDEETLAKLTRVAQGIDESRAAQLVKDSEQRKLQQAIEIERAKQLAIEKEEAERERIRKEAQRIEEMAPFQKFIFLHRGQIAFAVFFAIVFIGVGYSIVAQSKTRNAVIAESMRTSCISLENLKDVVEKAPALSSFKLADDLSPIVVSLDSSVIDLRKANDPRFEQLSDISAKARAMLLDSRSYAGTENIGWIVIPIEAFESNCKP